MKFPSSWERRTAASDPEHPRPAGLALVNGVPNEFTKAEPVDVRPEMSVAEAFETIVTACIRHFRQNAPLVVGRRDVEGLHQVRVAIRRLSAAFALFRPAISGPALGRIEADLDWFARNLGDARNFDVYLQRDLPVDERRIVERDREEAYDALIAAMNSQRLRRLMSDLVRWAATGEWRSRKRASNPVAPFAGQRIDRMWKRISRTRAPHRLGARRRHRLRIRAKKLRYSLEFARELHSHRKRRHRFTKGIKRLQEDLGQLNDIAVARKLAPPSSALERCREKCKTREHLRGAERALRRMRRAGRYWKG
jgi:CHAD domain-containing protein